MSGYTSPAIAQNFAKRVVARVNGDTLDHHNRPYRNVWAPLPGPQSEAYECQADELFYGGAAGGGKTDLAIGLALTKHKKSIIFRRIYKNLRGIIDRTIEVVGHKDGLNQTANVWRNLPGGRTIEFGAMQYEHNKQDYKGIPHDLYVFDEAPDFTETQVTFVTAWLRTIDPDQRCRIVYTGNPPTSVEGEWIIRRFAAWLDDKHPNPAEPGELRWYAMVDDKEIECADGTPFDHNGEMVTPKSRTFIPARVDDNPYYIKTGYKSVLAGLREPFRSQLLYGDFTIRANDDPWQVIPTEWVRLAQERGMNTPRPDVALRAIGADIAHGGADDTVIFRLFGTWFEPPHIYPGTATPDGDTAARHVDTIWDKGAPIGVDAVGYGASACDVMVNWGMKPQPINFGAGSKRMDKSARFYFYNLRAEAYWMLADALDPASGEDICLPPSPKLLAGLTAVKFKVVSGKIQLEEKEQVKARLGYSPDEADAAVITWYVAALPPMRVARLDW